MFFFPVGKINFKNNLKIWPFLCSCKKEKILKAGRRKNMLSEKTKNWIEKGLLKIVVASPHCDEKENKLCKYI